MCNSLDVVILKFMKLTYLGDVHQPKLATKLLSHLFALSVCTFQSVVAFLQFLMHFFSCKKRGLPGD